MSIDGHSVKFIFLFTSKTPKIPIDSFIIKPTIVSNIINDNNVQSPGTKEGEMKGDGGKKIMRVMFGGYKQYLQKRFSQTPNLYHKIVLVTCMKEKMGNVIKPSRKPLEKMSF